MQERKKLQNKSASNTIEDINRWNIIAREYDAVITRGDCYRTRLLDPVMYELIGTPEKKIILDAGCGQGYLAHTLATRGGAVTGIDGAEKLIAIANERYGNIKNLRFFTHDLTKPFPFSDASFDLAIANMVLMDVEPIEPALREIARTLTRDGSLVFSILHPLFLAGTVKKGIREFMLRMLPFYAISRYATPFKKMWNVRGTSHATAMYHRSFETYARALHNAGFAITDIREPVFSKEDVQGKDSAMQLLSEIPMFLIIRAQNYPQAAIDK